MRIIGVAIGALMIGGAVIALTGTASADGGGNGNRPTVIKGCMNPDSTNYNEGATEDDGSCIFADEQDQQDYVGDLNEQKRKEEEAKKQELIKILRTNCSDMYNTKGIRQKDSTQKVLELNKTGSRACDVNQLQAIIYTDKEYYIVGETVNVYVGKRYYETDGSKNYWHRWGSASSAYGEELGFKLGVWDEYAEDYGGGATVTLKSWGSALNGAVANNSLPTGLVDSKCKSGEGKTYNCDGEGKGKRQYSWQKFTFNTSNLTIVEPLGFTVKAKIFHECGFPFSGKIDLTKDKQRAFTIFPKTCSIDNLKEFGVYEAEQKKENYAAETSHLKQSHHSFIDNWW
jgi:hypothetical protein